MSFCWTPDALRAARRLYLDEGLSASESARRLGTTRSALIAKAHRMGWAAERDPALASANLVRGGRSAASVWRRAVARAAPPATATWPAASKPKPWLQRGPEECAFPVSGDGEAVMSCCAPSGAATYCAAHTRAMYVRRTEAQRQALDRIAEWVDRLEQPKPQNPEDR
jgi:hypothetical protein